MKKTEVLVADDHKLVREGIVNLLGFYEEIKVIGEAKDGLETVQKVRDNFPDLVLLDLNMPRMNGIDTVKKIKEITPDIKILILTIHDDQEYIYEVTKAGAEGYIQKDIEPDQLRNSIKKVMNGKKVFPAKIEEKVDEKLEKRESQLEDLSNRENEVLELLAQGMSNRDIAEELYISEKTVKNHVSSILKKFSVNDRTQAVIVALKNGLVSLS